MTLEHEGSYLKGSGKAHQPGKFITRRLHVCFMCKAGFASVENLFLHLNKLHEIHHDVLMKVRDIIC